MAGENVDSAVKDLHREVSMMLLKSGIGFAVRTPRGQKEPGHIKWDPRSMSKEISDQNVFELERNNDNLGIHLFGDVVDVDLDSQNPFLAEALDYFLPPTPHVWGRASRPKTHRLYQLSGINSEFEPAQHRFLNQIKKHEELELEVRGGQQRNGEYSLLPGSVHPSGETYQWQNPKAAKSTPAVVSQDKLMTAIRFACVAALIAPYWTEGSRNDMCMSLSGFLYRSHVLSRDLDRNLHFVLDKEDAKRLLEGVMAVAGDDEEDRSSRLKTLEHTWEKGELGTPVKGATSLYETTGDDTIVKKLYSILTDVPSMVEFEEFSANFAIWENSAVVVDLRYVGSGSATSLMNVSQFHNSYLHKNIETPEGKTPMTQAFMRSSSVVRFQEMCFEPRKPMFIERPEGLALNHWRGYEVEPYPDPVSTEDVRVFVDYVREILACGDAGVQEWLMAWFADLFQHPEEKPGTALVLVGKQGAGKSFVFEKILSPIIGRAHSASVNTVEHLTNKFNTNTAYKLLIQCNEATNSRQKAIAAVLKDLITGPVKRIEPKNVNAYDVEDVARYVFTSNEMDNAVALTDGLDDRRYTILAVSDKYAPHSDSEVPPKERLEYWNHVHAWFEDRENLAKVHRYLADLQYDKSNIRKPLDTEARRRTVQGASPPFDEWLMHMASMEHPFGDFEKVAEHDSFVQHNMHIESSFDRWPDYVRYAKLKESYDRFRRGRPHAPQYNEQQIMTMFKDRHLLPQKVGRVRKRYTSTEFRDGMPVEISRQASVAQMPDRNAVLAYLDRTYGFQLNESEDLTDKLEQGEAQDDGPAF